MSYFNRTNVQKLCSIVVLVVFLGTFLVAVNGTLGETTTTTTYQDKKIHLVKKNNIVKTLPVTGYLLHSPIIQAVLTHAADSNEYSIPVDGYSLKAIEFFIELLKKMDILISLEAEKDKALNGVVPYMLKHYMYKYPQNNQLELPVPRKGLLPSILNRYRVLAGGSFSEQLPTINNIPSRFEAYTGQRNAIKKMIRDGSRVYQEALNLARDYDFGALKDIFYERFSEISHSAGKAK